MKKHFGAAAKTAAAALCLLFFAACTNTLTPPERNKVPAKGKGMVRIGIGAERTAMPSGAPVFTHYKYFFSKDGGEPVPMVPAVDGTDAVFELYPGNWELTLSAFTGAGEETPAAEGREAFNINLGEETSLTVKLYPLLGGGTGTLNYTLQYPSAATVESLTLSLLAGDVVTPLSDGAGTIANPFTGSCQPVSGYYLVRARVKKDGIPIEKTEVAHIYQDMTTDLALEFVDSDFMALVVVSGANSGPGTLREALTAALSGSGGATILIDLPAGDRTITLTEALPQITKSLLIEGNGATLTQRGFVPLTGSNTQLVYVSGAATEVRIRRLHLTGGRAANYGGAIRNSGKLTLESCVLSDNRTSNPNASGGAIYTGGASSTLTVSGCTFYKNNAGTTGGQGGAIHNYNGTLSLTGNVFWGNTAAAYPVLYLSGGSFASGGGNVSDKADGSAASGSGWSFINGDKRAAALPFSAFSFRPLGGGEALNVISTRPPNYPAADFYGVSIPETGAASGAAQTAATGTGFILDYGSQGPGAVSVAGGTVDVDGFASGSVTLRADPDAGKGFAYWIVDGAPSPELSNQLTLSIGAPANVRALFGAIHRVNNRDSGDGSLRQTLDIVVDGDTILFPQAQTITLVSPLPEITKSLVIEGNATTLTQSGFVPGNASQLLYAGGAAAEVRIRRVHFRGGRSGNYGGAIQNAGSRLTLESCIFSDNTTGAYGGALYSAGNVTLYGCTFYGNSGEQGGAIYQNSGSLTLTGNIFRGNTAKQHNAVYGASVASGGFNVSDMADGTDAVSGSGWTFTSTDIQAASLPFSPLSFKPLRDGEAPGIISAKPLNYPATDFYGVSIPGTDGAAGAVQTAAAGRGYFLDYGSQGPGTVSLTSGTSPDSDGLISGSVTLTATAGANGVFRHWTVDGVEQEDPSPPNKLVLDMEDHKTVRGVFYIRVISTGNDGPGSLRKALADVANGEGIVLPAGQTITLTSPLLAITKSFVIEGNGATLTQNGFAPGETSQLLYINSAAAEIRISRLHFKGGRATTYGAAIRNKGTLALESCIFSDNETTNTYATGGAIYSNGLGSKLTVSGCTFSGNSAGTGYGGAIYNYPGATALTGAFVLTGNVFLGNTAAAASHVVYSYPTASSGGYNVSDRKSGTDDAASGWAFVLNDITLADLSFDADFKPSHAGLPVIPSPPVGFPGMFPALYFDGSSRGTASAPGAMPARTGN
jgi:predicted outer membrane repeat protein